MPVYEYICKPNGHRFEVRQGVNDVRPTTCPECGGDVQRIISPVGIVFKGAGFYATDSRSASRAAAPAKATDASATGGESNSSGETGSSGEQGSDGAAPKAGDKAASTSTGDAKAPAKSDTGAKSSDTAKA